MVESKQTRSAAQRGHSAHVGCGGEHTDLVEVPAAVAGAFLRPPRLPSFFAAAAAAAAADSECLPWIGASPPTDAERCFFSASC